MSTDRYTTNPSDAEPVDPAAAPDPRRWVALGVFATATLMVVLDIPVINLALPDAQAELGMSDVSRGWVVTAYTLAFGGLLLLGGRTGDLVGRKKIFLLGLAGFAVASMTGGLAPTAGMLFAARGLQGVFAALLAPAALSLLSVTFVDDRERAKAFAVYGAVGGAGGAVGLLLGGLLTEYLNWRWCLFVNVPIALLVAVTAIPTVRAREPEPGRGRYDLPGAITVTGGSVALVYGVTLAGERGDWMAPAPMALFAAAVVLLVAFVIIEHRSPSPLLPLRVLTDRLRGGCFATSGLLSVGMFAMFLFLSYYLQIDLALTPLMAGLALLPFSSVFIVTAVAASTLLPRHGPRPLLVGGMLTAALGMGWLTWSIQTIGYWPGVFPALVVMGVGLCFVLVPLSSIALTGVEPADAGVASALLNATQQIGGAIGIALLSTLYTSSLTRSASIGTLTPDAHLHGYRLVFAVATGFFVAALLAITAATRAQRQPTDIRSATPKVRQPT